MTSTTNSTISLQALPKTLLNWIEENLLSGKDIATADLTMTSIAGDASDRKYYRLSGGFERRQVVVMDCPADASMHAFIDVDRRLLKQGLRAPEIFYADLNSGYLLLDDLGDELLKNHLNIENGGDVFQQAILPVLAQMQRCDSHGLPAYNPEKLREELDLFVDWFCDKHCQQPLSSAEENTWQQLSETLINNANAQAQRFVHRDFHCCNVLYCGKGEIGILDFQDAVVGPASYDLVSWIWDRYIDWPRPTIESWIELAREELAPETPSPIWLRHCDLMGLQRNLKIVGIFCRLNYRDKKSSYLKLLPRFANYILECLSLYPELVTDDNFIRSRLANLDAKRIKNED